MPREPQRAQTIRAREPLLRVLCLGHGPDIKGNRCPESFPKDETILWVKGPRADRGFSLIEMLVALVVLSLSLGALIRLQLARPAMSGWLRSTPMR